MKLHELSVKRPVAVTMAVLMFVVIGLYSLTMLKTDMMPEMEMPMAIVATTYSNVGSEEIEDLVTKPIESAVSSVQGVDSITAQSSEGVSLIMLSFVQGTVMDDAVRDIEDRIDLYAQMLPEGANDPMVIKLDTSAMPIFMMSATYEGYSLVQTKQFVDDNLKTKLEAIDGVASVSVTGASDRVINVTVDPDKMHGYDLSTNDLASAIAAQNLNMPAGATEGMNKDLTAKAEGEFKKAEDVASVPIMTKNGQVIYISDVATVTDTFSEIDTLARLNGENALSISITKESDANTVDVVNGVKKVLEEVKKDAPHFGYNITMESASYIENAISSVVESGLTAAILAIIILVLFLGNVRSSLIIAISMPVSIILTFIGFYFMKMTLNVVSLGSLTLGIGMLVDNSVVVLENIFRRRTTLAEDPRTAALKGSGEVLGSVVASVITTCIVYVPILFLDNMMAEMFKQLAFVIVLSQIASLLATFLLVPTLSERVENVGKKDKKLLFVLEPFEKMMNKLYTLYEQGLRYVLSHRKRFMLATIAVFVVSVLIAGQLGMTLMPESDEGVVSVSVELPKGSKLESTDKIIKLVEEKIKEYPEAETIFSNVGSGAMSAIMGSSSNSASITVTLKDNRKTETKDAVSEIRQLLSDVTGAVIEVSASSTAMSMSSNSIEFNFSGDDDEKLYAFVNEAEKVLADIDGVAETSTSISDTQSEVRIKLDNKKAAKYAMNTATVASQLSGILNGKTASTLKQSGSEYDINIVYPENYITDYSQLKTMQIKSNTGQWISLSDIADVKIMQGQTTLTRIDRKRTVSLTGALYGTDMGTANREFNKAIKELNMPEGINMVAAGSFEVMVDAMLSLTLAIFLGILLMYMVMAAQFENLLHPFIILFTVPLSLIGVIFGHVLSCDQISVLTFVGMLMLIGIIVNNAILLIDFISAERKEKPDETRTECVVRSALTRIRPILMTTLTSVIGFMPMAMSKAEGSEMMAPLAVTLVGGLAIGSLLTLFVIPVIYTWMDDKQIKRREKKKLKRQEKISAESI